MAILYKGSVLMKQITNFGDRRQFEACAYCRGICETRDHVPSRVLLDEPFPENMAVVPACLQCNNLISADEQYLACVLECVLSGTTDPSEVKRQKIARLLLEYPLLRQRIAAAHRQQGDHSVFDIEEGRVKRVVIKLAQGHSLYELNEPQTGTPDVVRIMPLPLMNTEELEAFESLPGGVLLSGRKSAAGPCSESSRESISGSSHNRGDTVTWHLQAAKSLSGSF